MSAFEEFGVLPELIRAVEELDWLLPTPVQAEAIPLALTGGDLLVAAETGSGKTGAFCLPVIQIVYEALQEKPAEPLSAQTQIPSSSVMAQEKIRMSLVEREANFAIDDEGYICQARLEKDWQGGKATGGIVKGGPYYYEMTIRDEGLCRVGWSTKTAKLALGTDKEGFGFGGTGKKSSASKFLDYGAPFGLNDTIGCLLDRGSRRISFSKNGQDLGVAFEIPKDLDQKALFPAVTLKNAEVGFNFGQSPLKHLPPGATALTEADAAHLATSAQAPKSQKSEAARKKASRKPQAIILAPNRELSDQISEEIGKFKKYLPASSITQAAFYGSVSAKSQLEGLEKGIDIVVGTPGRILDLVNSGHLSTDFVRFLVLDEADKMVSGGQLDFILKLFRAIPQTHPESRKKRVQVMLYSATLRTGPVQRLIDNITKFPTWVDLAGVSMGPETVHNTMVFVDPRNPRINLLIEAERSRKFPLSLDGVHAKDNLAVPQLQLSQSIKQAKPAILLEVIKAHQMERAIVFCRTKLECDNLESYLVSNLKLPQSRETLCVSLHGDKSAEERKENLGRFKDNRVNFLLCTDIAARGIDVAGLPYMINYSLPDVAADYIHRIGRVGRADRMGLAVSLIGSYEEKVWYHSCSGKGKGCTNTKLKEEGGCAIWINEKDQVRVIEENTGMSMEPLTPEYQVEGGTSLEDGRVIYGAKRVKKPRLSYHHHFDELAPAVRELEKMEHTAQNAYFLLKTKDWR